MVIHLGNADNLAGGLERATATGDAQNRSIRGFVATPKPNLGEQHRKGREERYDSVARSTFRSRDGELFLLIIEVTPSDCSSFTQPHSREGQEAHHVCAV